MDRQQYQCLFWDDDTLYDAPSVTQDMIATAMNRLGYQLPEAYLNLIAVHNGGVLKRTRIGFDKRANRDLHFVSLIGIGGQDGIDTLVETGETRNRFLIRNWGYPDRSVVVSHFGHEGWVLDYTHCGQDGVPPVLFVQAESYPDVEIIPVCRSFDELLLRLHDSGETS